MKLTRSNYYSNEAAWEYMSVSQFKAFRSCESRALAELRGDYQREDTTALQVGSYIDAALEGPAAFEKFKQETPGILKKNGEPYAHFQAADTIIERIKRDKLLYALLRGQKQVTVTGVLAGGVKFKGRIDSLLTAKQVEKICKEFPGAREAFGYPFLSRAIVDGKVMKDMDPVWDDTVGSKLPFVEAWGYHLQGAVYQELCRQVFGEQWPFVLAVATKEKATNLGALYVPQVELDAALSEVEELAPRYAAIKRGEIEPVGCGECDWCRANRKLTDIKDYRTV